MGRTIIVGDVHGCFRELERLLKQVQWQREADRLYFVGDLASRGPEPIAVLRFVRRFGAGTVLGNHENGLVRWHAGRHQSPPPKLGRSNRAFAHQLDDDDWSFIRALPLYLDLPEHDVRIVHAGILPNVPMDLQPRHVLLSMRYLDRLGEPLETREPPRGASLWGERYTGSPHVVFGHYALPEVQIHRCATGIDTGAVYGNRLTAMVLSPGQQVPPPEERASVLSSVASEHCYFDPQPHLS